MTRFALVLALSALAARADLVLAVKDGDTILVQTAGGPDTVRLQGIDAPELKQPFGQESKRRLAAMILGRDVLVVPQKRRDRYRRLVARVYLGEHFVNVEMVASGHARRYPQYDPEKRYLTAEAKAQRLRRGLWGSRQSSLQ